MFDLMQVFASCDSRNFDRYAESLLASIDINSPGQKVVLHVLDPDEDFEDRLGVIRRHLRSTFLEVLTDRSEVTGAVSKVSAGSLAARRFRALADYVRSSGVDTLAIGIDSLVMRDLYAFPNAFPGADLAIRCDRGHDPMCGQVQARVIWLRSAPPAWNFLARVAGRLHEGRYSDSTAMTDVLAGMPQLRVHSLPQHFITSTGTDQGIIWAAKHERNGASQPFHDKRAAIRDEFYCSKTIAILSLRVDLGGKAGFLTTAEATRKRLRNPVHLHWQYFPKFIRDVLNEKGCQAEIICKPLWEIDRAVVKGLPHEVIFVPHRNCHQIDDSRVVFYMQELYPFFFTVDVNGWAASSSRYGSADYREIRDTFRAETFAENARSRQLTKYPQSKGHYENFDVFFPLQVPGDEALRFHSDYPLKDIVHAVVDWAEQYGHRVLFKRHPQNPNLDYLKLDQRKLRNCQFVAKGNVHELLKQAKVVFVANSGVGFEALLHDRPLVVFGRAIYDVVALRGSLDAEIIEEAYQQALAQKGLHGTYMKFIEWYLFRVGVLLDQPSVDADLALVRRAGFPNRYNKEIAGLLKTKKPVYLQFGGRSISARLVRALHSLARWPGERMREGKALVLPKLLPAEYFSDKRVALVGNGVSHLQREFGEEIDAHDVVIRTCLDHPLALRKTGSGDQSVQAEWLADGFEHKCTRSTGIGEILHADAPWEAKERLTDIRRLGEKTTVWAFSTKDRQKQRFYSKQHAYTLRTWMRPDIYPLHYSLWPKSRRLSSEYVDDLRKRQSIQPSASLILVELLRRAGVAGLDIYGFGAVSSEKPAADMQEDDTSNTRDAELAYVHGQVAANPGFQLRGFRYDRIPIGYHAGRRVGLLGFGEDDAAQFRRLFPGSSLVSALSQVSETDISALRDLDVFAWGRLDPASEARIRRHGIVVTRVSPGPVRNAWCFDKAGLHTLSSETSELLYMLRHLDITDELAEQSDNIFENLGYPVDPSQASQANRVLAITEEAGDEDELVALAERENPDVVIARIEADRNDVDVLHPFGLDEDVLSDVRRVYTRSAPLALVAVLRGIRTTVLGEPFYAGWGLTDDRVSFQGRSQPLSRQRLFTAVALLYPRYFASGGEFALPPELLAP